MAPPLLAIVDYDEAFREMLDAVFTEEGYRTLLLVQGSGAHAAIRQARPDLVLLDLWLERQDSGWTLLEQVRADPATHHIPVIVCSAVPHLLPVEAEQVRELGGAIIDKPFDVEELLAAVRQALSQRRSAQPGREARPAGPPAATQ